MVVRLMVPSRHKISKIPLDTSRSTFVCHGFKVNQACMQDWTSVQAGRELGDFRSRIQDTAIKSPPYLVSKEVSEARTVLKLQPLLTLST
ncbi:hypothetical protein AVEN_195621-1 [Araneus ventricosus]|uniref:Uncharacterized protein n=1 Tax=Araneus ventricosus TaxID=182803 RepID=A0A4Y2B8E1_ARAVE|nr:hypothetical protein AVEN_195621-1 [Araneus ventricosus]